MKAIQFHDFGPPEVLQFEDLDEPQRGSEDVVVQIKAVAVNRIDLALRSGSYPEPPTLPHILGRECAGVVLSAPDRDLVGKRVWVRNRFPCGECPACTNGRDNLCAQSVWLGVNRSGGYAEQIAVPVGGVALLPDDISYQDAACVQLAFGTAWHALHRIASVAADQAVLITAGSSGVGTAAIQIARYLGAHPILTTTSGPSKADRLRDVGADVVFDSTDGDEISRIRNSTRGRGVDVIVDLVGGPNSEKLLGALSPGGALVMVGTLAGASVNFQIPVIFGNEYRVLGSKNSTLADIDTVMRLLAQKEISPVIDSILPLRDAASAHRLMANREVLGKIVLEV